MWTAAGMLVAAIVVAASPSSAQGSRQHPSQDECPQGRQLRAQKSFPAAMSDCEVLDADTAQANRKLQRKPVPPSNPQPNSEANGVPSFDCARAATVVERLICSDKKLSELDRLMADAFKKALDNQADKKALVAQQQKFLAARNDCGKEAPLEIRPCVQQLLGTRAMYLSTLWKKEATATTPAVAPSPAPPTKMTPEIEARTNATFMQARACIRQNLGSVYSSGAYGAEQVTQYFSDRCFGDFSAEMTRLEAGGVAAPMFKIMVLQELGIPMPKLKE